MEWCTLYSDKYRKRVKFVLLTCTWLTHLNGHFKVLSFLVSFSGSIHAHQYHTYTPIYNQYSVHTHSSIHSLSLSLFLEHTHTYMPTNSKAQVTLYMLLISAHIPIHKNRQLYSCLHLDSIWYSLFSLIFLVVFFSSFYSADPIWSNTICYFSRDFVWLMDLIEFRIGWLASVLYMPVFYFASKKAAAKAAAAPVAKIQNTQMWN